MNRLILVITILFSVNIVFAQDGVFLHKTIWLGFDDIESKDSLVNFELYQNGDFIKGRGYSQRFALDSLTNIYRLSYAYQGIGGGNMPNYLECPSLLVKLNFIEKDETNYFLLIPIIPSICSTTEDAEIEVLNINLNPILNQAQKVIIIHENGEYEFIDQADLEKPLMIRKIVKIG